MRYWVGAGRGGFGISPLECLHTSFYCMVYKSAAGSAGDPLAGWTVKTSPVPIKDPFFATVKSTNYLANALVALDAQLEGYDQVRCPIRFMALLYFPLPHHPSVLMLTSITVNGTNACIAGQSDDFKRERLALLPQGVFVDSEGFIAEGPVMNIGIITHEGELAVPPFEQSLAGITMQRLLHLMREARCLMLT